MTPIHLFHQEIVVPALRRVWGNISVFSDVLVNKTKMECQNVLPALDRGGQMGILWTGQREMWFQYVILVPVVLDYTLAWLTCWFVCAESVEWTLSIVFFFRQMIKHVKLPNGRDYVEFITVLTVPYAYFRNQRVGPFIQVKVLSFYNSCRL